MNMLVCIFFVIIAFKLFDFCIDYFYHIFNAFKELNRQYTTSDKFIHKYEMFTPVILNVDSLKILLEQTELLDMETDSRLYCSLTFSSYRIGNINYYFAPWSYYRVSNFLMCEYKKLLSQNKFYKNNKEQLEEIEKGPFYTTEQVKERLRARFPFLKDLR